MRKKNGVRGSYHSAWMAILLPVLACAPAPDDAVDQTQSPVVATTTGPVAAPPSYQDLANATFAGIIGQPVQLVNGLWEGEPFAAGGASRPRVGLVEDFILEGDLTGDGADESVALLWSSYGGSGTFEYVAAASQRGEETSILGTADLGDRVKVRSGRIVDGQIELDVVQAGPDDATCCPTQLATRSWGLGPDGLTEGEAEITGTLSVAVLADTDWRLTRFTRDEKAPAEPEVTLTLAEGRLAGSSGCNRYFADVEESDGGPGSISVGPAGSTQMMCPEEVMQIEDRFLRQLGGANSFSFLIGKLVIDYELDGEYGSMFFEPR